MGFIRKHLTTIIVAMITAMVTAGAPALAHGVQHALFAHNADKVDGKHAVGAGANLTNAAGKLVAHNGAGKLPPKFIPKVGDANNLDGLDSTAFQRNCTDGAFVASGFVNAQATTASLSTTGLDNVYTCIGAVTVREDGAGFYSLRFANATDGIFGTFTPRVLVTSRSFDSGSTDNIASYNTYIEGGFVHVQVNITDPDTGNPSDDDFVFVVTDVDCSGLFCDPIIFSPENQKPGTDATTTHRGVPKRENG